MSVNFVSKPPFWSALISIPIVVGLLSAPVLQAQDAALPEFDAASVKLNTTPPGGREGIRGGDLRFMTGMVVGRKVSAYHLSPYELSAGPDWLESVKFELEAKAVGPANENQLRSMLRTLLRQRSVAKGVPKLLELKEGEAPPATAKELSARGVVLPKLDRGAGVMNDTGTIRHLVRSSLA